MDEKLILVIDDSQFLCTMLKKSLDSVGYNTLVAYTIEEGMPDVSLVELREFYCPGCLALLATETVPPGFPVVFEMLPDLDTFYRDWLDKPLADEKPDWFEDRTVELTAQWAKEVQYGGR